MKLRKTPILATSLLVAGAALVSPVFKSKEVNEIKNSARAKLATTILVQILGFL